MIGTDFPYQQFFPKDATIVQIDSRGEQLGRRTKVDYGFVGDTKTTIRALLPKLDQNGHDKHLKASLEHYRKTRKDLDELATEESGRKADPSAVRRPRARRTCGQGRHFLLRCGYANRLGRALPHHERHAAVARLLQSRIDGERAAAGHRGAGQSSGPSGGLALGGRRPGDADGRSALASAIGSAGEDHRVQERLAGVCRTGDESGRHSRFWNRPSQSEFRKDGRGRRAARPDR